MSDFEIEASEGFLLSKVQQAFSGQFKERLKPYDLTPPQFGILAFLWRQDGLSQIQLSNATQIDRTTIVGIIDRLERRGLVVRRGDRSDRRCHLIFLTPEGKALQDTLENLARQVNNYLTTCLSEGEKAGFRASLKKLLKGAPQRDTECESHK